MRSREVNFLEFLKNNTVVLDGGMGTLLQGAGLGASELPERWSYLHPEVVTDIHKAYFEAGSNVVNTNTFGANLLKLDRAELERIISSSLECARLARDRAEGDAPRFISLDIGPTGRMLKPFGDLDFNECVEIFAETVRLGVKYGCDLITIETMNDSYETKAAVIAAKENSSLPIIVTNAYGSDGKLMTGATPEVMVEMLTGLGVDVIGANCSLGPDALYDIAKRMVAVSDLPIAIKPNAGMPREVEGRTVFDVAPDAFKSSMSRILSLGVRCVGGCCGTTPEYIKEVSSLASVTAPAPISKKDISAVCSYNRLVTFGTVPMLIGERINPTGKRRFKEALISSDIPYILEEGIKQEEAGADILDVNVGIPDVCERDMLSRVITELQAVTSLPLCIDTSDTSAMEGALRLYNGKALINSVNGKRESMERIFPLAKKYGGVIIALTLDEGGIPDSADERIAIAKRIIKVAQEYGIDRKNLVFDPLAMTVSSNKESANITLECIERLTRELGVKTSLGVSNISFGLPNRDVINSTFFALAMQKGLSMAIMNPLSVPMMNAYRSYLALAGLDEGFSGYIEGSVGLSVGADTQKSAPSASSITTLKDAIVKGVKETAAYMTAELLGTHSPLDIVNGEIIPALDEVGRAYEAGRAFLPELLMSAEAAKTSFEKIKAVMPRDNKSSRGTIVIATVKGDIHDIGKNIVRLLLENYGFTVYDLGKDVSPDIILEQTKKHQATLVMLSALMTTTVPAMREATLLIHRELPAVSVAVGGAVLTEEYAKKIGADLYAKDAMGAVRIAEEYFK